MNKSRILKNLLNSNETLIMPDAYDPVSAKLIEKEQFKAYNVLDTVFLLQLVILKKMILLFLRISNGPVKL